MKKLMVLKFYKDRLKRLAKEVRIKALSESSNLRTKHLGRSKKASLLHYALVIFALLGFTPKSIAQDRSPVCRSALSFSKAYQFKSIIQSKEFIEMTKESQQQWLKIVTNLSDLRVKSLSVGSSRRTEIGLSMQFIKNLNHYTMSLPVDQRAAVKAKTIVAVNGFQKDLSSSKVAKSMNSERQLSQQTNRENNTLKSHFVLSDTKHTTRGREHLSSMGVVRMNSSSSFIVEGEHHDLDSRNTRKGHKEKIINEHGRMVSNVANAVAKLPDGRYISFGADGRLVSWNLSVPKWKKPWQKQAQLVYEKEYTGDPDLVFTGGFYLGDGKLIAFTSDRLFVFKEASGSWDLDHNVDSLSKYHKHELEGVLPLGERKVLVWDLLNRITIWRLDQGEMSLFEVLPSPKVKDLNVTIKFLSLNVENNEIFGEALVEPITGYSYRSDHGLTNFRWYQAELSVAKLNELE